MKLKRNGKCGVVKKPKFWRNFNINVTNVGDFDDKMFSPLRKQITSSSTQLSSQQEWSLGHKIYFRPERNEKTEQTLLESSPLEKYATSIVHKKDERPPPYVPLRSNVESVPSSPRKPEKPKDMTVTVRSTSTIHRQSFRENLEKLGRRFTAIQPIYRAFLINALCNMLSRAVVQWLEHVPYRIGQTLTWLTWQRLVRLMNSAQHTLVRESESCHGEQGQQYSRMHMN